VELSLYVTRKTTPSFRPKCGLRPYSHLSSRYAADRRSELVASQMLGIDKLSHQVRLPDFRTRCLPRLRRPIEAVPSPERLYQSVRHQPRIRSARSSSISEERWRDVLARAASAAAKTFRETRSQNYSGQAKFPERLPYFRDRRFPKECIRRFDNNIP
jgi:hypothetical protein